MNKCLASRVLGGGLRYLLKNWLGKKSPCVLAFIKDRKNNDFFCIFI
jgi:hypothetical protein